MASVASVFWKKWKNAGENERLELAKELAKIIDECSIVNDYKLRMHCIVSLLKSYLEDYEKYLEKGGL